MRKWTTKRDHRSNDMIRSVSIATILAAVLAFPALAQDAKSPPAAAVQAMEPLRLTADQAKTWIDKQVYSSDDKNVGEIAAFARGADSTVTEMHIDIGGFLGMGETRVRLMPAQFKLQGDRAVLNVTAEQAKSLPTVQNKTSSLRGVAQTPAPRSPPIGLIWSIEC